MIDPMVRRRWVTPEAPAEIGKLDGLSYSLWAGPDDGPVRGGVVIVHGAGSSKESHHDFARAVLGAGFAAIAFDLRGHGSSEGRLDGRVLEDMRSITQLLRARIGGGLMPIAVRGSSMGGYLAIVAAPVIGAQAVVAICPASADGLRRGLARRNLGFEADAQALDAVLEAHELGEAVRSLEVPLLILHAEGDEVVPVALSRELSQLMCSPQSRLVTVPGGHHRSIQHDPELQAVSVRFIEQALAH